MMDEFRGFEFEKECNITVDAMRCSSAPNFDVCKWNLNFPMLISFTQLSRKQSLDSSF